MELEVPRFLADIESQSLGLFCVTCHMFKMNLLPIIHPFLGWYHVAKLYWKCYIAFGPLVPSICGFIPIVSCKCTCAHNFAQTYMKCFNFFSTTRTIGIMDLCEEIILDIDIRKQVPILSAIEFSKLCCHFTKSWSTLAGFLIWLFPGVVQPPPPPGPLKMLVGQRFMAIFLEVALKR